jgi:hydroxymethylglutaryl-CoA lyase
MPQLVIREVGPRDGLQNEAPLNVERRAEIISALCRTGLTEIEAVSFV